MSYQKVGGGAPPLSPPPVSPSMVIGKYANIRVTVTFPSQSSENGLSIFESQIFKRRGFSTSKASFYSSSVLKILTCHWVMSVFDMKPTFLRALEQAEVNHIIGACHNTTASFLEPFWAPGTLQNRLTGPHRPLLFHLAKLYSASSLGRELLVGIQGDVWLLHLIYSLPNPAH